MRRRKKTVRRTSPWRPPRPWLHPTQRKELDDAMKTSALPPALMRLLVGARLSLRRPHRAADPARAVQRHDRRERARFEARTPPPGARPAGAPNVFLFMSDDVGFAMSSAFGGPVPTPNMERLAAQGPALQPLPHHRHLLPQPRRAADRAQPPQRRRRLSLGPADRLSRLWRRNPARDGDHRAGTAAQWLQHRHVRQTPQRARQRAQRGGAIRQLADRPWLRIFLRLPAW